MATSSFDALKQAQERLVLSDKRLKLALHAAHMGWWQWHLSTGQMDCSPQMMAILGLEDGDGALTAERFSGLVHAEDAGVMSALHEASRAGQPFQAEYRIVRPDGQVRLVALHAMPEQAETGLPSFVGTLSDVSERGLAEEALGESQGRALFGQLAKVEEEERRRLAREVHDAMGQHVTALTLGLKALHTHPAIGEAVRDKVSSLLQSALSLSSDIDGLAYRLHPTTLDDLGLDDALRELARLWSQSSGIPVDVYTRGLQGRRFAQVQETTIYRVVQESLNNVHKHARASHVSLIVENREGQLRAIVEDDGQGFEPGERGPHVRPRLGLRIMAERVAQLGGKFDIESSKGQGTTNYFSIPCSADPDRPLAPSGHSPGR